MKKGSFWHGALFLQSGHFNLQSTFIQNGKTKVQAKLIAFIDDASRVVPHGEFFLSENTSALIKTFRSALYKRGIPQTLYTDNGAIYTGKEINQICPRIGTLLCHAPVRDGAAKGKIERFFRTVRDRFLIQKLDLSSLETLNKQFCDWLESDYNAREHSTLKMRPVDRFAMDLGRIRFLDPMDATDELFYFEQDRTVRKDNTFQVVGKRFEAPRDLRSRTLQIRYDRFAKKPGRIIVFLNSERMGEATPLDPVANDRPPKRP